MSTYYRESFEYPPIHMFLDSSVASTINNNGNVNFLLNQQVKIPNDVIGYVSLQELTTANNYYNINTYNGRAKRDDSTAEDGRKTERSSAPYAEAYLPL